MFFSKANKELMALNLDPISRKWLVDVQRFASDPAIGASSNVPSPYPEDGAESWYSGVAERVSAGLGGVFAIEEDDGFRGVIALHATDKQRSVAHIDYWIAVPFQRKGIATRAISLCIALAKTQFGFSTLRSGCLARNEASGRALERNGFAEFKRTLLRDGKFAGEEYRLFVRSACL